MYHDHTATFSLARISFYLLSDLVTPALRPVYTGDFYRGNSMQFLSRVSCNKFQTCSNLCDITATTWSHWKSHLVYTCDCKRALTVTAESSTNVLCRLQFKPYNINFQNRQVYFGPSWKIIQLTEDDKVILSTLFVFTHGILLTKGPLHRRFLSRQLDAIFVAL